ncbi:unnamed protein product [Urochloa humidicola]
MRLSPGFIPLLPENVERIHTKAEEAEQRKDIVVRRSLRREARKAEKERQGITDYEDSTDDNSDGGDGIEAAWYMVVARGAASSGAAETALTRCASGSGAMSEGDGAAGGTGEGVD